MKRTTTTSAALALAAVGVVLTAGTAHADPAPDAGWTITGDAANPWHTPDQPWTTTTLQTSPPPAAGSSGKQRATSPTRQTRAQRVARNGRRPAPGCQGLQGGVWLVRPGDTLWQISICTHHDLADLVTANQLPDGGRLIFPGDRITVSGHPTR